jgi:radical SAM protein with 4Fe4S-binding SPASM domain
MIQQPVEAQITNYLYTKASYQGLPLSGTFELTPCCNMTCKMCYVRKTKAEQEAISPLRTPEEWIQLGERAKQAGMLYLLITGGEPFLYPGIREVLTRLHYMGLIISINTNGTLIDAQTIEWLKECPPSRFNITLYGASDETYARLCGNPKGFTQATQAIRLLKEAGFTVKINCSVTPHNVHDLEGIFAFAREEQLVIQATSYMFPPVRRDVTMTGINERFTPEAAAYQAARITALTDGYQSFLERMEKHAPLSLPDELEEDCPKLETEGDKIRCRAGKCSFWITWEGNMLPCGIFPNEGADNVFDLGFERAWENVRKKTSEIRLPAKCKTCELRTQCKACAAMVITESGDFHTAPEYRCRMSKSYLSACNCLKEELLKQVEG